MTGRATFGGLATDAEGHLARAASLAGSATAGYAGQQRMHAADVRRQLSGLIAVMNRYLDDISDTTFGPPARPRRLPAPWTRALAQAQQHLRAAATLLAPDRDSASRAGARGPASPVGRSLKAAAASLAAGRELLGTHLSVGPQ